MKDSQNMEKRHARSYKLISSFFYGITDCPLKIEHLDDRFTWLLFLFGGIGAVIHHKGISCQHKKQIVPSLGTIKIIRTIISLIHAGNLQCLLVIEADLRPGNLFCESLNLNIFKIV